MSIQAYAQERTMGLTYYSPDVTPGYTLITSHHATTTYLIDNCGNIVHFWESEYLYGNSVEVLPDGRLLRSTRVNSAYLIAGGAGGRVEILDWEGNIEWEFTYASEFRRHHHETLMLPNGNILILAWDARSKEEALQAGIKPEYLGDMNQDIWGEHILEIKPVGRTGYEVVWEWYLWDHLVQDNNPDAENYGDINNHPERVNLNYNVDPGNPDWIHANAIAYNESLDQIMISCRNFNEIWIIDHSTTTEEAASSAGGRWGKGGDLLYRYGNPQTYNTVGAEDQKFFGMHNPQWISNDTLLLFNNGQNRTPAYSEIVYLIPPVDNEGNYLTETAESSDLISILKSDNTEGFEYSPFISGVQRLQNNHFLVCSGPSGTVSEFNESGERLWTYVSPLTSEGILNQGELFSDYQNLRNLMFRSVRYSPDYSGLEDRILTPSGEIEINPFPSLCNDFVVSNELFSEEFIKAGPNPVFNELKIFSPAGNDYDLMDVVLFDIRGKVRLMQEHHDTSEILLNMAELEDGVYFLQVYAGNNIWLERVVKQSK